MFISSWKYSKYYIEPVSKLQGLHVSYETNILQLTDKIKQNN